MEASKNTCEHHPSNCQILAPCCNQTYPCRICHDTKEDHTVELRSINDIVCNDCQTQQPMQRFCCKCGILFAKHFCTKCKLYDNELEHPWHCSACGFCRNGGKENYFHCPKCNMCLPREIKKSHKCVENMSRQGCPVCLEDMHSTMEEMIVPPCSHLIHSKCFEGLQYRSDIDSSSYRCPVCREIHSLDEDEASCQEDYEDQHLTKTKRQKNKKTKNNRNKKCGL